jgi:hypothetical protein
VQSYFDVMTKALPLESLDTLIADDATADMAAGTDDKRGVELALSGRDAIVDVIAKRREAFAKLTIIHDIYRVDSDGVALSFLAEAETAHPSEPAVRSAATYDVVAEYHLDGGRIIHFAEAWTMRPKKRKRRRKK